MEKLIHDALSRKIIGAAMDVLNELKPGLDEKLYERALAIELRRSRRVKLPDALIAATALCHGLALLTMDVGLQSVLHGAT